MKIETARADTVILVPDTVAEAGILLFIGERFLKQKVTIFCSTLSSCEDNSQKLALWLVDETVNTNKVEESTWGSLK